MRRSRRLGQAGSEFPSSGEDSFVAVVVTKLTGALLFILLLAMVIMALLPKAVDRPPGGDPQADRAGERLAVATPEALPEAIAGRPYVLALAATGAKGPLRWAVDGPLPAGLGFDPKTARIQGTPRAGIPEPVALGLQVSDGTDRAFRTARLVVYQPDGPLSTPSRWAPGLPPIPWRAWMEQGFGFLVLLLVHLVGMNTVAGLERYAGTGLADPDAPEARAARRRFAAYRVAVRLATLGAMAALAVWLWSWREA